MRTIFFFFFFCFPYFSPKPAWDIFRSSCLTCLRWHTLGVPVPLQDICLSQESAVGNAAQWGQGHSDREPSYCRWLLFLWKTLIVSALDGGKPSKVVLLFSTVCAWSGKFRVAAGSCEWRNQAACPTLCVCAALMCLWSHMRCGHTFTCGGKNTTTAAFNFPLHCWDSCVCWCTHHGRGSRKAGRWGRAGGHPPPKVLPCAARLLVLSLRVCRPLGFLHVCLDCFNFTVTEMSLLCLNHSQAF